MAALIAPRPLMVERGHFDGVAPDEAVGYEFAKVRRLYQAQLGISTGRSGRCVRDAAGRRNRAEALRRREGELSVSASPRAISTISTGGADGGSRGAGRRPGRADCVAGPTANNSRQRPICGLSLSALRVAGPLFAARQLNAGNRRFLPANRWGCRRRRWLRPPESRPDPTPAGRPQPFGRQPQGVACGCSQDDSDQAIRHVASSQGSSTRSTGVVSTAGLSRLARGYMLGAIRGNSRRANSFHCTWMSRGLGTPAWIQSP